jgi:YVTN family beta-propeller protein
MFACGLDKRIEVKYILIALLAIFAVFLIASGVVCVSVLCVRASAQEATSPIACTANTLQDTVSVIDMNNNTIFGTVFNISSPTGVAIDANDSRIYVTNGKDNTVTIVDLRSYEAIGTISVGSDPVDIAISPDDNTLYVANSGSNSLSIINVSQSLVNATVTLGMTPSQVKVNPVSGDVYVSSAMDNEVGVIRGNTKVATIMTGKGSVSDMAITPDGSLLYVVSPNNNSITAYNTTTFDSVNTVLVGNSPDGIDINPGGQYAFISNLGSGNISMMQLSDSSVRVSFNVDSPGKIALRPTDGRMAYILSVPAGNVTAMDTETGDVNVVYNMSASNICSALVDSSLLIDMIPPVTTAHVTGISNGNGSFIGRADCYLTAIDYPSGTEDNNIQYSLDGLNWLQYKGGNITYTTPGYHYLYYRATDSSGNVEHVKSSQIVVLANSSGISPTAGPTTVLPQKPTALPPEDIPTDMTGPTGQPSPDTMPTSGFELVMAAIGMICAGSLIYYKKL